MKLMFSSTTADRHFARANRRHNAGLLELKRRIESVSTANCVHDILLLAFVDQDTDFFRIVPGDKNIFEVEVGYDYEDRYSPEDDVLLIQLIEEKLMLAIDACEALGAARQELKAIVEAWTTEYITPK
jgi:hypothetical protein